MARTFTCAGCRGTFDQIWSDEEARAEELATFGVPHRADDVVVCDDCYKELLQADGDERAALSRRLLRNAPH